MDGNCAVGMWRRSYFSPPHRKMTPLRAALFLIGCMGARIGAAWAARVAPRDRLPVLGAVAAVIAAGFFIIYAFDLRKTGAEVFGERIWWNALRPVHGTLYATFAILAIQKNESAWIVLAADAALGLAAFVRQHGADILSQL